jgi:hypothetical protein
MRPLAAAFLLLSMPVVLHAGEPVAVKPIRVAVHEIDQLLPQWEKIITDDECLEHGCDKTTIWLDEAKRIRKISSSSTSESMTGDSLGKYYTDSYYDEKGLLIFKYIRDERLKKPKPASVREERYYVQGKKLLAWKSNETWHQPTDPEWVPAEIEIKSDVGLDEQLRILKSRTSRKNSENGVWRPGYGSSVSKR